MVFEGKKVNWLHKAWKWGPKLAEVINKRFVMNLQNDLIMATCGIYIKPQPCSIRGNWHSWPQSSSNIICNMAMLIRDGICLGGALIRNLARNMKLAIVKPIPRSCALDEVVWFSFFILKKAEEFGFIIGSLQSSHPIMSFLQSPISDVPIEAINAKRRFLAEFPAVNCAKICPRINGAAIALVCTTPPGDYWSSHNLPRAVIKAMSEDTSKLPSCCAEGCNRNRVNCHDSTQDDLYLLGRRRYNIARPLDDSTL